jgi:surface protein
VTFNTIENLTRKCEVNKSFRTAQSIFLRRMKHRLETGFSMLEAVVVVGVLLALAVGGFLSYGPIIENAKTASVKSAASQVLTAATVASLDGQSDTDPQDVISAWNESTERIEVKILEPAGGVSENGDFCIKATDLENPSISALSGSCAEVVDDGGDGGETPLVRPVMETVWNTSLPAIETWHESCTTITLPLSGTVDVTVDWGDGSAPEDFTTDHPSHSYVDTPGLKTIRIEGNFTRWVGYPDDDYNYLPWSQNCITAVNVWEETGTTDVRAGFSDSVISHVSNIPKSATDWGDLFSFTSFNGDISGWDTSHVTNMEGMFFYDEDFNRDIRDWDTSNVTNMSMMFFRTSGFNWDLSGWSVGNVVSAKQFSYNSGLTADHLPPGELFLTQTQ